MSKIETALIRDPYRLDRHGLRLPMLNSTLKSSGLKKVEKGANLVFFRRFESAENP